MWTTDYWLPTRLPTKRKKKTKIRDIWKIVHELLVPDFPQRRDLLLVWPRYCNPGLAPRPLTDLPQHPHHYELHMVEYYSCVKHSIISDFHVDGNNMCNHMDAVWYLDCELLTVALSIGPKQSNAVWGLNYYKRVWISQCGRVVRVIVISLVLYGLPCQTLCSMWLYCPFLVYCMRW